MKTKSSAFTLTLLLLTSTLFIFSPVTADSEWSSESEVVSTLSVISVLVVYPDEGAEELRSYGESQSPSGQTTISGYVEEVFNYSNQMFFRSGLEVTFDVLETMAINFSHTGDDWKSRIPSAMMNPGIAHNNAEIQAELAALRDVTAADVVVYWRMSGDGGPSASGATPFNEDHPDSTYVHLIKWHMNPRVVAHELGHLLGGEHHVGLQAVANMSYDGGPFELREIRTIETSQVSSLGYGSALYLWVFSDANATFSGTIPCGYSWEHNCTFAEPTVVGNENQSNVDQMLRSPSISEHRDGSEYPSRSSEIISGSAELEIFDSLEKSSNISAVWVAQIEIHDEYGTDLLPNQELGLRQQIDLHLGDSNGWIGLPEVESMNELIESSRNWTDADAGGCCSLDHTAFIAEESNQVSAFVAVGPVERQANWGWAEQANLTGQSDVRSTRLLDLPRVGALVEEIPLTITLPIPYEYRYSAMQEIIDGVPNSFTVNRSDAPVASNIRISIGLNEPPNIVGNESPGSTVALDRESTYEANCVDSHLDDTEISWQFSNNGSVVLISDQTWVSITPSEYNFSHGDVLSIVAQCTDSFGSSSEWYENIVIDGVSPTWEASFTAQSTVNGATPIDISDGIIELGSEDILDINISASDDSGLDTTIEITSNRTSEWRHVDWNEMFAQSLFPQGDDVNNINLDIEDRHQAKPATTYSLHLTVTDDAGNSVHHDWVILVLDGAGPTILPDIYSKDVLISAEHPARADEPLLVNLTNSYDDLDSIYDTRWTFILNQEPQFENQSFADIQTFEINPLEAGSHWFILMAWDSKDNMDMLSFSIAVQPSPGVDLRIWNISYDGIPAVGETLEVHVIVQNLGGDPAAGRLCSGELCSSYINVPWATASGPGVIGVSLVIPLEQAGELPLHFEWEGSLPDEENSITIDSDIIINPDSGTIQVIIGVFLLLAGLAIGARMLWGPERFED